MDGLNIFDMDTEELRLLYDRIGMELENRDLHHTRIIEKKNYIFHIVRLGINEQRNEIGNILEEYDINNMKWYHDLPDIIEFNLKDFVGRRVYRDTIDKFNEIIIKIESLFKGG